MERKDAKMYKILPAIALCLALQPALADDRPAGRAPAEALPANGLMHATLVVQAQPVGAQRVKAEQAALKGDLPAAADAAKKDDSHDHTAAMLLAALALMAGIVLRRGTQNP